MYVTDQVASITPPVKRLRAFQKIALGPEKGQVVTMTITEDDLKFVGVSNTWIAEEGMFSVEVDGVQVPFYYSGK
jgi:beta-glucosidase